MDARDTISSTPIFSGTDISDDLGMYGAVDEIVLFKRDTKMIDKCYWGGLGTQARYGT